MKIMSFRYDNVTVSLNLAHVIKVVFNESDTEIHVQDGTVYKLPANRFNFDKWKTVVDFNNI